LAQAALDSGDNDRALSEAQTALKIKPDSQLAILNIAQAGKFEQARGALASFLEQNPTARDVRLAFAGLLVEQQDLKAANTEFEILLKDNPKDLTVLYSLGILRLRDRSNPKALDQAREYFEQYVKLFEDKVISDKDPSPALINLAEIAIEKEDFKGALVWLEKIDPLEGKNPLFLSAVIRRAEVLGKLGQNDLALELIRSYETVEKKELRQLGLVEANILRNQQKFTQAKSALEKVLSIFPEDTEALYDFAMVAETLNRLDEMETALRKVISIAPDNQHAYNALGYVFADKNIRLEEALSLVEKARQIAPEDPNIMDSLGWVKFRLGKFEEAESILVKAYALRADADIAIHLGEVLWTQGKEASAKKYWAEARRKNPDSPALKAVLKNLR